MISKEKSDKTGYSITITYTCSIWVSETLWLGIGKYELQQRPEFNCIAITGKYHYGDNNLVLNGRKIILILTLTCYYHYGKFDILLNL